MQPLQICIGPIIRIGQESWCLPYAGFFHWSCLCATGYKEKKVKCDFTNVCAEEEFAKNKNVYIYILFCLFGGGLLSAIRQPYGAFL